MNYSTRKHMERLLSGLPEMPLDPFGIGTFAGLRVIESPDRPRYTLPAEVIPGVPWPPGFREELNRWSLSFLGTTNILPLNIAYMLAGGFTVMRPADIVKLQTIA